MKRLDLKKREVDLDFYKVNRPAREHFSELISEPVAIYENDVLRVIYDVPGYLDDYMASLRWAVKTIKYSKARRSAGLNSVMRTFGYAPRHTSRHDFCHVAALAREFPKQHKVLCDFAEPLTEVYAEWNPAFHDLHHQATQENVLPEYQLMGGVFTSGIVNKTTALGYHFDAGNVRDVWSNMVVLREFTKGGYLSVPEYDLGFELPDGAILLFDGQALLHGVTPIVKTRSTGYRYSVVYYSLRQMWNCLTIDEELARARKMATERARKRSKHGEENKD